MDNNNKDMKQEKEEQVYVTPEARVHKTQTMAVICVSQLEEIERQEGEWS